MNSFENNLPKEANGLIRTSEKISKEIKKIEDKGKQKEKKIEEEIFEIREKLKMVEKRFEKN